jgi:urease accessory protein
MLAPVQPESDALAEVALVRLMTWLSPAFPVGAFSYSHGLEWAVEAGDVTDREALVDWIDALLSMGGLAADSVFFARTHDAMREGDDGALRDAAELAAAFQPSRERRVESFSQGAAFLQAIRAAFPTCALERLAACWDGPVAYPVAVAAACAGYKLPLRPALTAFLHAGAANLVSAAVRLVPLGQTDGLRALAALEPAITAAAIRGEATPLDRVAGAALRSDIASMRHETQRTRLFRT